jgi:PAS domain S-box-containing protein
VAADLSVAAAVGVGVTVFVACLISLSIPHILHTDVLIWPVNAIVIALTLNAGRPRFVPMLLAAWIGDAAASLAVGETPWMAAVLSSCNMAAVVVSWMGTRRFVRSSDRIFESKGLWRFIVIAGGVAPLASAVIAAAAFGGLERTRTWIMLGEWVIANGLGAVIFVPILLVVGGARRRLAALPLTPRAVLALVALTAVASLVFALDYQYAFLLFPIFLLAVFEGEIIGAAAGSLLIMLAGVVTEAVRRSVLGHYRVISDADMLGAQLCLTAITLVGLPLATTLEQRRALRARLSESEENYRGLTEASEDLITRIDLDGFITFASRSSVSFGHPPGVLVGQRFADLVFDDDRARVLAFLELLQTGHGGGPAAEQIEFRLVDPSGHARWVEAKAGVIANADGLTVAVVKVLRDVTRRKIYESELAAARSESEAATRIKAEFLANMSHELRTPLTSVIGFTRLALGERGLSEVAAGFLNKAVNAGSLLLSIINDVLDYSKIESGHFTIHRGPVSPRALVRQVTELFAEPAAEKGLRLTTEVDSPDEVEISLDQDRIKQVLLNLVANAVKFSSRGVVSIRARWSPEGDILRVEVGDEGPGISPEDQPRLFTRFSQLNQTARPSVGGTGLGLAICRGLVEAMGGRIGVVSALGQGAMFWFEVPAPAATGADQPDERVHEIDLDGMRVLVADDHRENRELVRAILTPFGASVAEASSGDQAVQVAGARSFDLILMDLLMPDVDGVAAMRRIRAATGPNQSAPIIAFSAGLETLSPDQISDDGFDDGLSKPILPAALLQLALKYAPVPAEAG